MTGMGFRSECLFSEENARWCSIMLVALHVPRNFSTYCTGSPCSRIGKVARLCARCSMHAYVRNIIDRSVIVLGRFACVLLNLWCFIPQRLIGSRACLRVAIASVSGTVEPLCCTVIVIGTILSLPNEHKQVLMVSPYDCIAQNGCSAFVVQRRGRPRFIS